MNTDNYIESNPKIMFGKPVIKNTRIPVDLVLEKLAAGETFEQILTAYPQINKIHIYACLSYASESVKNELIIA